MTRIMAHKICKTANPGNNSRTPPLWSALTIFLCLGLLIQFFPAFPGSRGPDSVWASSSLKLGVLAKRGHRAAHTRWSPLAEYLSSKTGQRFEIVPLNFSQMSEYVSHGKLDLILANQMFFILFREKYSAIPLATLVNRRAGPYTGGVIFVKNGSPIKNLRDIRGKKIAIVSFSSAGGYAIQASHLLSQGIDIREESHEIKPYKNQDHVVYAVINRMADVGFVRTDQLESMAREGKINLNQVRVLNRQNHSNFPLLCSTDLWPAWPMASFRKIKPGLRKRIANALISLPGDSVVSTRGKINGFVAPGDYTPVAKALADLGLESSVLP